MKKNFVDRFNEIVKNKNLSQSELARLSGITQSSISDWLKGKYLPKQDKVHMLADALNVSPSYLMGYDDYEAELTLTAPKLGKIACGQPIEAIEDLEWIEVNESCDYVLEAEGDSMIGVGVYDGDLILLDKMKHLNNGEIGAICVGEDITLKKFYYYPEKHMIILKPANPDYEDQIYIGNELKDIRIIGRAKLLTRKYKF